MPLSESVARSISFQLIDSVQVTIGSYLHEFVCECGTNFTSFYFGSLLCNVFQNFRFTKLRFLLWVFCIFLLELLNLTYLIRLDLIRNLLNINFWFPLGIRRLDSPSETCLSAAVEPIMNWLSSYLAPLVSLVPGLVFETTYAGLTHLMTCFRLVSCLFFQKLRRDHSWHEVVFHDSFSAKSGSYLLLHCRCFFCA